MLVLTRRIGEEIVIDEQIRLVVTAVQGDRVRLGICAPATVRIDRQEVHERRSLLSGSQRPGVEAVRSYYRWLKEEAWARALPAEPVKPVQP